MKKSILWLLIVMLTVSIVATFSLAGCDKDKVTVETAAEEVSETVEEETVEEAEAIAEEEEEAVSTILNEQELFEACAQGNFKDVKRLIEQNVDVNAKDNDGWTALMYAAVEDHTEIVEILMDNGADIDTKDNDGITALMYAATFGHTGTVGLLIENGADVNAKDNDGMTALMYAEGAGHTETADLLREEEEEAVEESIEDTQSSGETTTQVPQGPSKATYLNNINNIINEYNMAINHMNVYYEKIEFSNLDSFIDFERTFLDKIEEINGMLQNTTPASGYESAQAHFIDLSNVMYSQVQMTITYLEQENFDAADNMVDEFNKTFKEFVDYYNSL